MNRFKMFKITAFAVLIAVTALIVYSTCTKTVPGSLFDNAVKNTNRENLISTDSNEKNQPLGPSFKLPFKLNNGSPSELPLENNNANTESNGNINENKVSSVEKNHSSPEKIAEKCDSEPISDLTPEEQKKANEEANAFVLKNIINDSDKDSEVGDGSQLTGALRPTPEKMAEEKKNGRVLKRVRLNKIGLARINAERSKKGLPLLVAGLDVQIAPMGKDIVNMSPEEMEKSIRTSKVGKNVSATDSNTITENLSSSESVESAKLEEHPLPGLPSAVDNSTLQYFPPIRNQSGNSCAQWSAIYYNMTHETAMLRGWDAKTGGDYYRFCPMFTYNMINGGENVGSWMTTGWDIAKRHGVPRWSEFYTTSYKTWCTDPDVYRRMLEDRTQSHTYIQNLDTEAGLDALKANLNNGHIASYGTYIYSWKYKTAGDDPATADDDAFVGKDVAYMVDGTSGGHAMTVVGYDDNIWCDIDGDSVVDANEKGALRIANSWGTGWKENGFCWISYEALRTRNPQFIYEGIFWSDYVIVVTPPVTAHNPTVIGKITVNHSKRNQVESYHLGINSVGQTTPLDYASNKILFNQGGEYAFDGGSVASQDFTYYLDFTEIAPSAGETKRWFLHMGDSGSGDGNTTLKNFDLYLAQPGGDMLVGSSSNVPVEMDGNYTYAWIDWTYEVPDNWPPVAQSQSVSTVENTDALISLTASDAEGDDLEYTIISDPSNGTLSGTAPNLTYIPDASYYGSDSFTWRANDGTTDSNIATVTINVTEFIPEVSVAATDATAAEEGQDTGILTITRTGTGANITNALNVNFSLGGTATETVDFSINNSTPVTIPADQNSVTVTLTPVDDSVMDEGTETVSLNIGSDSSYILGTATAIVNIAENDITTYTVSYDGNGYTSGTVPADQAKAHNIDLTLTTQGSMLCDGYIFKGWNTAADGNATHYDAGATYSDNAGITLFAEWILSTPPVVTTLDPADNSSGISNNSDLAVTFNEDIVADTGNITVKNLTDGTDTVIDINDAQVSISGSVLTINPSADLDVGKDYAVQIDAGAVTDLIGSPFAGIADDTTWNFQTATQVILFSESFENPDVIDDVATDPTGWDSFGHPNYINIVDENDTNTTLTSTPYGEQALSCYQGGGAHATTTASILSETVSVGTTYILSFNVAAAPGRPQAEYTVYLLAVDGEGTETVLGTLAGTNDGTTDMSYTDALEVTPTTNDGERLAIRLQHTATSYYMDKPIFDHIKLIVSTYTVIYAANTADDGDVPVDVNSPYDENATVTVLGNTGNLTKVGYSFSEWNTQADGEGESYAADATFNITENTTLYAQWTAASIYTLTVNNGTGGGSYTEGVEVSISATVPAGQHFVNWTGNTANLADVNRASTTITMPASAVTVTANFADGGVPHSADTDNNWTINQSEVNTYISSQYQGNQTTSPRVTMRDVMRVIYLYNGGGAYIGGQTTYDGYDVVSPGAQASAVTTTGSGDEGDGSLVVSSTADSGVGSLRDAINIAADGETIIIGDSVDTITVLSEIVIDKSITIDGQGAAIVTGDKITRIFKIQNDTEDINVTLKNLGIVDAENNSDEFGGAIYNNGQTLNLDTVLFDANANTSENGKGGAVYSSGTLSVDNCVFRNNTASDEDDVFQE